MLKVPTTLVLGAGASMQYGFPNGMDLVTKIVNHSGNWGEHLFENSIREDFRIQLRNSGENSIDAFLARHEEFMEFGKFCITKAISDCENEGNLMARSRYCWYSQFFNSRILNEDICNIAENLGKLRIVTFNYDRSLEKWLMNRLIYGFRFSLDDSLSLLSQLQIVHVHGQIGQLASTEEYASEFENPYKPISDEQTIQRMSRQLHIIAERSLDDSAEFSNASSYLSEGKKVAFFGFGYHPENMRRLGLHGEGMRQLRASRAVLGTFDGWNPLDLHRFQMDCEYIEPFRGSIFELLAQKDDFST